jgi:hypothetical protein
MKISMNGGEGKEIISLYVYRGIHTHRHTHSDRFKR